MGKGLNHWAWKANLFKQNKHLPVAGAILTPMRLRQAVESWDSCYFSKSIGTYSYAETAAGR
jgi:hypothetical protein